MKTTFKINILYYSTSFEWAMRDLIFMTQVSYVITFPYQFILQDACRGPKLPTAWKTTMNISERVNFIFKHVEGYLQNNQFNTDKSCEVIL